jgi:tRNA isopentenyl-2-thiomethyl-A-37 hydroxylase MiaE
VRERLFLVTFLNRRVVVERGARHALLCRERMDERHIDSRKAPKRSALAGDVRNRIRRSRPPRLFDQALVVECIEEAPQHILGR